MIACPLFAQEKYKDVSLDFEERAADLVSRMTLDEKAGQMIHISSAVPRLGIPAYNWWNEALHGVGRSGLSTVFPQAIGMGAMWDDELMYRIATAISDEARAKHHDYVKRGKRGYYQGLTFWSPNINIFRDPRWGRGMETYGEDPFLTASLGGAFVKGLQGNDTRYLKTIATAKHFVAHSGPESLRHSFDASPSLRDMEETYLPHFKKLVKEAGVYSVMCAYNSYLKKPCCGNKELEMLLRGEWGFNGYIVSDCSALRDFYDGHNVADTPIEAAVMAVEAGTDLNCGSVYKSIPEAVRSGRLDERLVDRALIRLFTARMRLGMFDNDSLVPYAKIPLEIVDSPKHRKLATEAASKSLVLLKNENKLLPLSKGVKKVAVIGPNADEEEVLLGNYNGFPSKAVTPLSGIKAKLPDAEVNYAQGCPLAPGLPLLRAIPGKVLFTDETLSVHGMKGEYFDNRQYQGNPIRIQTDENIDFQWWKDTSSVFPDTLSIRWTGVLVPPVTGEYAIGAEAATAFTLFIDNKEIARWTSPHHPHKEYELLHLEAGKKYNIRMEYVQSHSENAMARLLWEVPNPRMKEEAVQLARQSDIVILCMGLSPLLEGEEMKVKVEGFDGGDRLDIKLPTVQTELMKEICALGKPTVLVLLNGSAVAFNWEAENIPAILEAWYPGQAGGTAIADVLFGDTNPSGRLPVTFYSSVEQLPSFDNYSMEGKTYKYFTGKPLYPFGYGLSYTTFTYKLLSAPSQIKTDRDSISLTVEVQNTGDYSGEEVVQLYVTLKGTSCMEPIRSLQGFKRVALNPQEKKKITFNLKPQQFAALNERAERVVEPGKIMVSIGGSQPVSEYSCRQMVLHTIDVQGKALHIADN